MSVTITSPQPEAKLKGIVSVTASFVGEGYTVATCTLGGIQLGSDSALPIVFAIDTAKVPNGSRVLTVAVKVRRPNGTYRWQKASIQVMVENLAVQTKPSIPKAFVAVATTRVDLRWDANPLAESVDAYQVYIDDANLDLDVAATSFVATEDQNSNPLEPGSTHSFRVSAHNSVGYSDWTDAITVTLAGEPAPEPEPVPTNRYTDISFNEGKYNGEGISSVFCAYQSDPRLSDWGGLPADLYDSRGCTQDQNMRVHLVKPESIGLPRNPANNSQYISWHELRTTDGPWASSLQTLAKSSMQMPQAETFGPGGFSHGCVRWFAWDYLLPLNINGVSFEIPSTWHGLADIHDGPQTGGNPCMLDLTYYGNKHPQHVQFANTPNQNAGGVPYLTAPLVQITNNDGSRITSAFNVWHEVVVGLKFSANADGWQEVWSDGVVKLAKTLRANIKPEENGPYAQLQNYTGYPCQYVGGKTRSAIVYGGFRAGMTRADVQTR